MSNADTFAETVRDGWHDGHIMVGHQSLVRFTSGMASLLKSIDEAHNLGFDTVGDRALEFTLPGVNDPYVVTPVRLTPDDNGWRLEFGDGSELVLPGDVSTTTHVRVGTATETEAAGVVTPRRGSTQVAVVDEAAAINEPFTVNQYASIEGIVGWLWDAAQADRLTESQQAQILAIAQLIEDERRDTVPEETNRQVMVRLVQRSLKYIVREMPKDALAMAKLSEILRDSGWLDTLSQVIR